MKVLVADGRKTKADAKADFVLRGSSESSDLKARDMTRFINFDLINFDLESGGSLALHIWLLSRSEES